MLGGNGRQQGAGVGMGRTVEQVGGRRRLDDAAEVHHRDAVRNVAHQGQVVRDEQVGEAVLGLLVDYLGLDRHVEGRHGLVAHHEPGIEDEGPGDSHPLELATRHLVGEAAGLRRGEADPVQDLVGPQPRLRA